MRDIVLRHVVRDRAIRLLDVGCGTGALVFRLADALPLASIVGVDVSPANIGAADRERAGHRAGDRIRFATADYLRFTIDPVEAIVTDTALHFIRGDPAALWLKLSRDLRPGGVLVCCMAYDCAFNRAWAVVRRIMRRTRTRALDSLIVAIARAVHGRAMDVGGLRERAEYMYIPPEQLLTRSIVDRLAPSLGLRAIEERDVASPTVAQLKQRVTVFRKD